MENELISWRHMTFTPILTLTAVRRYPCTVVSLLRRSPYLGAYGPATLALESGREPKLARKHKQRTWNVVPFNEAIYSHRCSHSQVVECSTAVSTSCANLLPVRFKRMPLNTLQSAHRARDNINIATGTEPHTNHRHTPYQVIRTINSDAQVSLDLPRSSYPPQTPFYNIDVYCREHQVYSRLRHIENHLFHTSPPPSPYQWLAQGAPQLPNGYGCRACLLRPARDMHGKHF